MLIRIEGVDLPGLQCGVGGDFPGYQNIHVAVQRRNKPGELLGLTPGNAPTAVWELECKARATPEGGYDLLGPHIQGGPGARFVYLSWGTVSDTAFTLFRRAKIWLDAVPPEIMQSAVASGLLHARLGLTDPKGHPTCASLRPPQVTWTAPPAAGDNS